MPRKISEETTRKELKAPLFVSGVDPQLESAGRYLRDHVEGLAMVEAKKAAQFADDYGTQ